MKDLAKLTGSKHEPSCWGYPGCLGCKCYGAAEPPKEQDVAKFKSGDRVVFQSSGEHNYNGREATVRRVANNIQSVEIQFDGVSHTFSCQESELWAATLGDIVEYDPRQGPPKAPDTHAVRKAQPVARGVLDYFADALLAVSEVSVVGNRQHNGEQPLHWAYGKSSDAADCIVRHLIDRGTLDTDGVSHSAKVAWRALALLQQELETANPELHAKREAQRALAAKGERP